MSPQSINEQAAHWAERIRGSELSDIEYNEFRDWISTSGQHEQAFIGQMMLEALSGELRRHPGLRRARWRQLLPSNTRTQHWWPPVPAVWLAAGLLALTLSAILLRNWLGPQNYYSTAVGEVREIHLADGSVAFLNTRTTIRTYADAHGRLIDLVNGEALFNVRPDPSHPFIVNVRSTRIRVTGTKFNVYRRYDAKHDDVLLTVLTGTVDVSGPETATAVPWHRVLRANEELIFSPAGIVSEQKDKPAEKRTRWLSHVIEVENNTLADVVTELSRYTDTQIVLADPRLSTIRIVATLDVRSIAAALNQLQTIAPIRVERSGNTYILHYRVDPREKAVAVATE